MKKLFMVSLLALVAIVSFGQKRITAEEIKTFTKGAFEVSNFDEYLASDGHLYKVGDTLKLGRPSSNKTFAFVEENTGALGVLGGVQPTGAPASVSGSNSIIKRIYIGGTKKSGFRVYMMGKGLCALCPQYSINFEEAVAVGELKSLGMNKENAIAKLKEQKELLDMGMISKEEFEKTKTELTPYIMGTSSQN